MSTLFCNGHNSAFDCNEDCGADEFNEGFIAGVQWRINSVWHSTDDLPKHSGFLAVLMDNGIMETMYYSAGIGFHEKTLKGYALWAYISDLLPERKEVRNDTENYLLLAHNDGKTICCIYSGRRKKYWKENVFSYTQLKCTVLGSNSFSC